MSNIGTIVLVAAFVALLAISAVISYGLNKQKQQSQQRKPQNFTNPLDIAQQIQKQISADHTSNNLDAQFNTPTVITPNPQEVKKTFDQIIDKLRNPPKPKTTTNTLESRVYQQMKGNNGNVLPKQNNSPFIHPYTIANKQKSETKQKQPETYQYYNVTTGQLTDQAADTNVPKDFELEIDDTGTPFTIEGIKYTDQSGAQGTKTITEILNCPKTDLLRATFSKIVQDKRLIGKSVKICVNNGTPSIDMSFCVPDDQQWRNDFIEAMKFETDRTFVFPGTQMDEKFYFTPDTALVCNRTIQTSRNVTGAHANSASQGDDLIQGLATPNVILHTNLSNDAKAAIIAEKFVKQPGSLSYHNQQLWSTNTILSVQPTDVHYPYANSKTFGEDVVFLLKHSQSPQCKECVANIKEQLCKNIDTPKDATNSLHLIENTDPNLPMCMIVCIQTDKKGHKTIKRIYDFLYNRYFDFNGINAENHIFTDCKQRIDATPLNHASADNPDLTYSTTNPYARLSVNEVEIIVDALGTNYKNAKRNGHQKWQKKKLRVGNGGLGNTLRNFYTSDKCGVLTVETKHDHVGHGVIKMVAFDPGQTSLVAKTYTNMPETDQQSLKSATKKLTYRWNTPSYFKKTKDIINEMQPGKDLASLNVHEIPQYSVTNF